MPTLLTISSWVSRGHVGNSALEFPLMRRGIEVVALPTLVLAHHLGHAREVTKTATPDLLSIGRDVLVSPTPHPVDGVLVGFLAYPQQAEAIAGLVAEARAYKEGIPLLVDPIAGDAGELYVDPPVVDEIRASLLPMADIIMPNVTELAALCTPDKLADGPKLKEDEIIDMARSLGVPVVIVTSAPASEPGRIANLVVTDEFVVKVEAPFVDVHVHGTGDIVSGLVLGEIVSGADIVPALSTAVGVVHDVLKVTADLGKDELALAAAQKFIAEPRTTPDVAML